MENIDFNSFKWNDSGLIPAVTQDARTLEVLMLAWVSKESLALSIETGYVHYFSRSRNEIWKKGETSGCLQKIFEIKYDCDEDSLLFMVEQTGAACHTGNKNCFHRSLYSTGESYGEGQNILERVLKVVENRRDNPKEGSYTNYLLDKGIDKTLKKVGEETAETIIAAKNQNREEISLEVSDLMYHLSVMMVQTGVCWQDIFGVLEGRYK